MAINQEIISTSWEGQQKSFIEAGLKSLLQQMLGLLEGPLAANSVGSNQLTQELRDVINSIGSKVPNTRTVNNKELSSNITLGQSDIPGLVAALAAKVGYGDDEWLQVKAGAMQAASAVPNTTTVNGKRLNNNIVIGIADIPGLLQAIANAGSGAVSVQQNADGSFSITVGNDTYVFDDFPTKQDMADAIDDALGEAQVTVVPASSVGVISSLGSDSDSDALSASMGKKLKVAIITVLSSLGNYAFPNGKPIIDWGDDTSVTYTVSKTIGTGLSATGGDTDVEMGDTLEVTIAITNNLYIIDDDSVVVTMGGQPVAGAWNASTMKVTIAAVTGNVVINVPSMTYVDVDGSNNQLAFMLDCKNRGGQTGHWIDLIGNKDFALTDVTAADDGMVFNGSTSKGVASGSLDVYYYNNTYGSATIEAVVDMSSFTPTPGQRLPILANTLDGRVAASFRTNDKGVQMIGCATNPTGVDDPNNNAGFFFTKNNKSFGTTGGTDGGIVVVDGNVPENPRAYYITTGQEPSDVHDYFAGLSSVCAVGYGNISSTNYYFKGKILAIRVYKTKLTAQQIIYNHNIDKKRFNLA